MTLLLKSRVTGRARPLRSFHKLLRRCCDLRARRLLLSRCASQQSWRPMSQLARRAPPPTSRRGGGFTPRNTSAAARREPCRRDATRSAVRVRSPLGASRGGRGNACGAGTSRASTANSLLSATGSDRSTSIPPGISTGRPTWWRRPAHC